MKVVLRNFLVILLFAAVAASGLIAFRGPNVFSALTEKRRQVRELQEQNASMEADNVRKRERIHLLKTSRPAQDLAIRERLKMLRPGETQFILSDPPEKE